MARFIFVHGAWLGGWCWATLRAPIEAAGHVFEAIDLPGTQSHPATFAGLGFDDWVAAVGERVTSADEPSILVAHSRGGMVATAVAERHPRSIAKLIYVAAFLPQSGQSLLDLASQDSEAIIGPFLRPSADQQLFTLAPEGIRDCCYGQCSAEDVESAIAKLVPEPVWGLDTPVTTTEQNFGSVERHYIETWLDKTISLSQQRRMQEALPCKTVSTINCDHSPFLSMPAELAAILIEIAI